MLVGAIRNATLRLDSWCIVLGIQRRRGSSRSSFVVPFIYFACRIAQGATVRVVMRKEGSNGPPHRAGTLQAGQLFDVSEEIGTTHLPYTSSNNALRTSLDDPLLQKRAGRREGKCRSIERWSVLN